MKTTIKSFTALIEKSSKKETEGWRAPRQKDVHRIIYGMFLPSERYIIDFADDFHSDGWEQYDTWQDAPYFGVWINKKLKLILTLCRR